MTWMSPAEIVGYGFERSPVVMMNEAHHGFSRCARTRRIGRSILPAAHAAGCRYLALEALQNDTPGPTLSTERPKQVGYLAQPEMIEFVEAALDLGWTLVAYEIAHEVMRREHGDDLRSMAATNHRERVQAHNLLLAFHEVGEAPMLVWCGNSHHAKGSAGEWVPMGVCFSEAAGFEPFSIDQTQTITFVPGGQPNIELTAELRSSLDAIGGTAGFVAEDPPRSLEVPDHFDALILSTDNAMTGDVDRLP
jgi:hypothetical protein